nr:MAG TPA: hypothetical protein [Caudoviricetes sp.]DAS49992.1 MAG TPA: hypothetical protein [Caudoviricetes sp.]DAW48789.1 MAG TPA: hypothetical protein [Caudoviricetes sp.]DAX65760.1 MAG TPA: hypothetical protein [Caudoviricetes sp.]
MKCWISFLIKLLLGYCFGYRSTSHFMGKVTELPYFFIFSILF